MMARLVDLAGGLVLNRRPPLPEVWLVVIGPKVVGVYAEEVPARRDWDQVPDAHVIRRLVSL